MKCPLKCSLFILGVTVAALGLRVPRLAERPMHGDEAIHAMKFGQLLEHGTYRYDPSDYHGPTLNYFTLIPAKLAGQTNLKQVNEVTLRIVPVVCGTLLVLMLLLLADGLGSGATIVAAILTAISPAMVFYSRYYIQEMLLVCFTFGLIVSGYRYAKSKNVGWMILAGVCAGLMYATKETCIIAFGSMLAALLLMRLFCKKQEATAKANKWHYVAAGCAAAITAALFYSSFFSNSNGITEALKAIVPYFTKASHNKLHIHPWYYYLQMLIYFKLDGGPLFTEALIVFLAGCGFVAAMAGRPAINADLRLLRFFGFYTLIMTSIYAAIPYKTPWCMLGFLHGMILLAGAGAVTVFKLISSIGGRTVAAIIFVAAGGHLLWDSFQANYKYYTDPVNPYVYAHPTKDVFSITKRVEEIAKAGSQGQNLYIEVICRDSDYWPLPWYFRSFNNVGWWSKVDEKTPAAPVIIASADLEKDVLKLLYEVPPAGKRDLYVPLFDREMFLRPNMELKGFVKQDLLVGK